MRIVPLHLHMYTLAVTATGGFMKRSGVGGIRGFYTDSDFITTA